MKSNPVPRDVAGTRFERVRVKAFWNAVLAFLAGRDNHLVSWSQAQDELRFQGESGAQLKNVPVKQIIGTVGRYEDFDRAFLPTHEGLSERWQSIRHAHEDGTTLPKVQLYQIVSP